MKKKRADKPQILYVDDEKANLTGFKYMFRQYYDIKTALSVKEAYQTMLDHPGIKIIIADLRMPEENGVQLLIRIQEKFPDTYRMILTGYSDIEAVIDAINKGHVYYYFKKPWNEDEVKIVIDNALEAISLKQQVKIQEEQYRNTFEYAAVGIAHVTTGAKILKANPCFCTMLGYEAKEIIGLDVRSITPGGDIDFEKSIIQQLLSGQLKKLNFEKRYIRKDQKIIWANLTLSMVHNDGGEVLFIVAVIEDITHRKQAEEALTISEARLREAQQISHLGHWELDVARDEMAWSDEIYSIFGFLPQQFKPKMADFINAIHPDDQQSVLEKKAQAMKKKTGLNLVHRIIRPDQETRYVRQRCLSFYDDQDRPLRSLGTVQDVTEQVLAREKIEEQKEFLSNILESLTHPFFVINADDYTIKLVNSAAEKDFSQQSGFTCYQLIHKSSQSCHNLEKNYICPVEQVKKSKKSFSTEHIHYDKNGLQQYVEVHAFPIFDKNEEVTEIIVYCLDITEKKEALKAVKENQLIMQSVLDNTPALIYIKDLEGRHIVANDQLKKLLLDKDQIIIGRKADQLFPPDTAAKLQENDQKVIQSGEAIQNLQTIAWENETITYLSTLFPLKDSQGKVTGICGIVNDITEQNRAEKELSRYRDQLEILVKDRTKEIHKLSQVVKYSPVSVIITDKNGNIEYVNPFFTRKTGYTLAEIKGKNPRFLKSGHLPGAFYRKLWQTILAGRVWKGDFFNKTKNGDEYWETASISPILNEKHEISNFIAVKQDVTDRKKYTEELNEAKQKAEIATRAKSDFLARMSHEIRTPMNAIIGMSYLVLKSELTDKQRNFIKKIMISGQTLLGIINDILDFSKIEANKLVLEKIHFNLNDVFTHVANLLTLKAEDKGLELLFDISDTVPKLLIGDPLRLGQILLNLTSNAIKFTEKGEIIIRTRLLDQSKNKIILEFSVKDTGIGIKPQQLNKLFQSFSQADTTTTRTYGGTGLGLAISKKLVEMMDGEISVKSVFNKGAVFTFTVHLLKQVEKDIKKDLILGKYKNTRILVVDDNFAAAQILTRMIRSFSFHSDPVTSGRQAIEMLHSAYQNNMPYHIIVLDWKMPDLDGIDTATIIQNEVPQHYQPIMIMITGYDPEDLIKRAAALDIDHFIEKPVSPSTLFNTLIDALNIEQSIENKQQEEDTDEKITALLKGRKILVAEDNEINQQFIRELLTGYGIKVKLARNGKQVLERLKADAGFELILMDLQMPVMDGYQAALKIRKKKQFKDIPIIALSADAIFGVKEKCLQSGMNDFISKPVDPEQLFSVIINWIQPQPDNGKANHQATQPMIEQNSKTELEHIALEKGISRLRGDRQAYFKLLFKFKKNHLNTARQIREAVEKRDYEQAKMIAHSIKGVTGNINLDQLFQICDQLNKKFRNEDYDRINFFIDQFEAEINIVFKIIAVYEKQWQLEQEKPASLQDQDNKQPSDFEQEMKQIKPDLIELKVLLKENNMRAKELISQLKNRRYSQPIRELIDQLDVLLEKYNFDDSYNQIQQFLNHKE